MMTSPLFWEARPPVTGRRLYQTLPHSRSGRQSQTYFSPVQLKVTSLSFLFSLAVPDPLSTLIHFSVSRSHTPSCSTFVSFSKILIYFFSDQCCYSSSCIRSSFVQEMLVENTDGPVGGGSEQHRSPSARLY